MQRNHSITGKTYIAVLAILMALTLLSVIVSPRLGSLAPAAGLGIGFIKATIVALYFMHLLHESFAMQIVIVVTAIFILTLILGVLADVAFR